MENDLYDWINQHKSKLGIKNDFSLVDVSKGESNHVYEILTENSPKYIVRTSKDISEDRINRESKILDLLEDENISFVPQKVYIQHSDSLSQDILVETYIGNQDIEFSSMSDKQLTNLAEKLAKIHSISIEAYKNHFNSKEPSKVTFGDYFNKDFKQYSKKPYESYKKNVETIDPRIESAYEKQKELFRELKQIKAPVKQSLIHGDPSDNLRTGKNQQIKIIDWELSRPGIPRFELTYMFRHNEISSEKRQKFLKKYEKFRELDQTADKFADHYECFLAFNDMIWAAKRNAKANEKRYEKLFEKRLEKFETLYAENLNAK